MILFDISNMSRRIKNENEWNLPSRFICCDGAQTKATVKYESNWRCTETMGMIDNCECAKAGLKVPEKCGADAQKEVEATCGAASAGTTAAP